MSFWAVSVLDYAGSRKVDVVVCQLMINNKASIHFVVSRDCPSCPTKSDGKWQYYKIS